MAGGPDHLAGPLVVHHLQRRLIGQGRLLDEGSTELGLALGKELANEILFDRDVLVEQLGQYLLVEVAANAHQRELEETRHRRRQDVVNRSARILDVEQDRSFGESLEDTASLRLGDLPDLGSPGHREGLQGQQCHESRFPFAEEHLQDRVEKLRRRRALRGPVEPVDQGSIAGSGGQVGHARSSREIPRQNTHSRLSASHPPG